MQATCLRSNQRFSSNKKHLYFIQPDLFLLTTSHFLKFVPELSVTQSIYQSGWGPSLHLCCSSALSPCPAVCPAGTRMASSTPWGPPTPSRWKTVAVGASPVRRSGTRQVVQISPRHWVTSDLSQVVSWGDIYYKLSCDENSAQAEKSMDKGSTKHWTYSCEADYCNSSTNLGPVLTTLSLALAFSLLR